MKVFGGIIRTWIFFIQYRRHKDSAVTKLRAYILKKLRSFNYPSHQVVPLLEGGVQEETMETESSLVIESNQETGSGHILLDRDNLDDGDSVAVSSSSETLEELVDQMEIEISDHEGEAEPEKDTSEESEEGDTLRGVASAVEAGGGDAVGKVKREGEIVSEKIEVSAKISTGRGERGEEERQVVREEGCVVMGRRRRQSSTHDRIEFPPISLDRQLSNEDILELMGLLQVRGGSGYRGDLVTGVIWLM